MPTTLRIAFWNTWLLAPRLWPGGPHVPAVDRLGLAPDVAKRAPLVAQAVAGRFDVAALAEVFDRSEQEAVGAGWPEADLITGPQRGRFKLTGSGLATLVDPTRVEVVATDQHWFRDGGDWRDSDTLATKGALLTRVRATGPKGNSSQAVDIVSTHVIAGGEFLPIPGHDDHARHHRARMAQFEELLGFIAQSCDPANPLLVVGDLNVAAHDPDPDLAHPTDRYQELAALFGAAGLRDLWAEHGLGPGPTCTFVTATDLPSDPEEADQVLDLPDDDAATVPGERIDYLWLRVPDGVDVIVDRPRRWAFTGRPVRGGPAGSLSDHLALSVTLQLP